MARQGVPMPTLSHFQIGDPATGAAVPRDGVTLGEVMLRGNTIMKGYLDNPAATDAAFDGGWFRSGDLGVRHPDGYIEIKDRSKDIIISGGENISSLEVEECLYRHPQVMEAAVVARPDDKWGETPCAFVMLKPGAAATTAADIIAWCRAHLAHYKAPRTVVFGPLPKTATGKIQKFVLRERRAGCANADDDVRPRLLAGKSRARDRRVERPRPAFRADARGAWSAGGGRGAAQGRAGRAGRDIRAPAARRRSRSTSATRRRWKNHGRARAARHRRQQRRHCADTTPALDLSEDDWQRVLDTNLSGAFRVTRGAARALRDAKRGGAIVNVASVLGYRVAKQVPAYVAAKAGLIRLTEALALELAPLGIRVNALAPGYVETDLNRDFLHSPAGETMVKRVPLRRFGAPADLDGALLLLASDAGRYVTGTTIVVDGGHMLSWL